MLHTVGPGGEHAALKITGMEGRDIGGIAVSHDGVRIALLSQEGGVGRLEVAGIVRGADGSPLSVGTLKDIGTGIGPSKGISWVDERIVAVLGVSRADESATIRLVTVGGRSESLVALPGTVDLTARNGIASIALVTEDGSLYVRLNTQWSQVASGSGIHSPAFGG